MYSVEELGVEIGVLTDSAEMYIWDVGQRRCVRRWTDEGGYRDAGRVFAGGGGPNGWLAIGYVFFDAFRNCFLIPFLTF
jgi:hypothetical protein